jgi:hypothetical protein
MDRGIGMDAFITAGHPGIGDGAITIDTGITATTTVDIGMAVKGGLKKSIRLQRMPTTAGKLSNGQAFNPGTQEISDTAAEGL